MDPLINPTVDPNWVLCWGLIWIGVCAICSLDFDRLCNWPPNIEIGAFADSPRFKR